jgi:hypothetical protein
MVSKREAYIDVPQLIGKNVTVYLTNGKTLEGIFVDDRGHAVVLHDRVGKFISIPWDKIWYIEEK